MVLSFMYCFTASSNEVSGAKVVVGYHAMLFEDLL